MIIQKLQLFYNDKFLACNELRYLEESAVS